MGDSVPHTPCNPLKRVDLNFYIAFAKYCEARNLRNAAILRAVKK